MVTSISKSPAETEALGEAWGRGATPGWVIGLTGDLGAGKTQLVKGLARGLGISARVHSPTFALVNTYPGGRLLLHHLDLYRLQGAGQTIAAGLDEFLTADAVTVIEWADRWFTSPIPDAPARGARPFPGQRCRWVQILELGDTSRRIEYEDFGD